MAQVAVRQGRENRKSDTHAEISPAFGLKNPHFLRGLRPNETVAKCPSSSKR
jgi:hypothetical protein